MTVIENSQLSVILAWIAVISNSTIQDIGDFFSLCWWFVNALNRSPTSQSCHQHISPQKSVTKIDVGFNGHFWQSIGIAWQPFRIGSNFYSYSIIWIEMVMWKNPCLIRCVIIYKTLRVNVSQLLLYHQKEGNWKSVTS